MATSFEGTFIWNELNCHDPERAKEFYAKTMGWTFEASKTADGETYWICKKDEKPIAGIFHMSAPQFKNMPEHWLPYIGVEDVDRKAQEAVEAGARLVRPVWTVPTVGRIALIEEPGGAVSLWMTPEM